MDRPRRFPPYITPRAAADMDLGRHPRLEIKLIVVERRRPPSVSRHRALRPSVRLKMAAASFLVMPFVPPSAARPPRQRPAWRIAIIMRPIRFSMPSSSAAAIRPVAAAGKGRPLEAERKRRTLLKESRTARLRRRARPLSQPLAKRRVRDPRPLRQGPDRLRVASATHTL